jgi:hypothetical protein
MVDAIVAGERDARKLAALRDGRVKASEERIVGALQGDYRPEHLFTLRQSLESYRHYQKLIGECDRQLREMLDAMEAKGGGGEPPASQKQFRRRGDEELRQQFYRVFGVDLTAVPSVNVGTVEVLLGEVGPDLSRFRSAGAFSNWLALCPGNAITGGKIISSRTRKVARSAGGSAADGGRIPKPEPITLGPVLPAEEGEPGGRSGDYGGCPQARPHPIHADSESGGIR